MQSDFAAFSTDDATLSVLRQWAELQGHHPQAILTGGLERLSEWLESNNPPALLVIDLDGQDDIAASAAHLVSLCGQNTKIIALGTANDVKLYRQIIAAGLIDYLVKPLTADILSQALALAKKIGGSKSEQREAKIIAVLGTRGGVGVSTIALNLGWLLAHDHHKDCMLVDLDLQFGTAALALDLEPGRGLRDVLSSPQRVDRLIIESAMAKESDHFAILSAEETVDDIIPVDSTALTALMRELTPNYHFIILDMPRAMLATQKRLLAIAHEIVLVSELSLAGIRDTLRIRAALKALGAPARITQVAGRVGPQHPSAVDEATFVKGTQAKLDFTIPEDAKSVNTASNNGKPLAAVAASTPLVKSLLVLAKHLGGESLTGASPKKTGLFGLTVKSSAKEDTPS
jgi:pilus assembly protein CpaE